MADDVNKVSGRHSKTVEYRQFQPPEIIIEQPTSYTYEESNKIFLKEYDIQ